MRGFQVVFFTHQDRRHQGKPIADWLIKVATELGVSGATVKSDAEGRGRKGTVHSQHFFELADQPLEVMFALSEDTAAKLFKRLEQEQVNLFYVKTPAEFGVVGQRANGKASG